MNAYILWETIVYDVIGELPIIQWLRMYYIIRAVAWCSRPWAHSPTSRMNKKINKGDSSCLEGGNRGTQ